MEDFEDRHQRRGHRPRRRDALPGDPRRWGHLGVVRLLMSAAPFTLFAVGEQHLPSVVAGAITASR